jgi:hypothetical protein
LADRGVEDGLALELGGDVADMVGGLGEEHEVALHVIGAKR